MNPEKKFRWEKIGIILFILLMLLLALNFFFFLD